MSGYLKTRHPAFWVCIAGACAMVAGAYGPWATWLGGFGSANGFDRGDGSYVVLAAVAAALLLAWPKPAELVARWAPALAAGLGVAGLVIFFTNWRDFEELKETSFIVGTLSGLDLIEAGWGIYAVGIGSALLAFAAAWLAIANWRGSGASAH